MSLPGIILAAGRSSRMGRDKALLPYGKSTFVETLIETLLTHSDPVVVVLGHHAEQIQERILSDPRVRFVVNEDYDRGMLSSLQTGLAAVGGDTGVVFTLVDHPSLRSDTLAQIVDSFEQHRPVAVIPRYEGERGHPVAISAELAAELAGLPPDASPKQVMRSHYPQALFLDLDDPAITQDIDIPAKYRALVTEPRP